MLFTELIKQDWKKTFRAKGFYKNLAVSLLMGFMMLYFAVAFFLLGVFLGDILEKVNDRLTPLESFNGITFYLLLGGILIRFFMMQLNTINLPAYQSLPIKRTELVNYLLLKPLFSWMSYFTLLVILPFAFKSVSAYYPGGVVFRFILHFILLIWFNTLFASFLKRKFGTSLAGFMAVILAFGALIAAEYFKIFSLFDISKSVFNFLVIRPFGWLGSAAAVFAVYALNRWFFSKNYYPEKFNEKLKTDKASVSQNFTFLEKYGMIGELIALQMRLIFRHKRTKMMVTMSAMMLFYGLIFYTNPAYKENYGFLFFAAIFTTGVLMIMYGQWIMSWESSYFDGILTKNIPVKTYMRANYYLLLAFNALSFILTTPYFFFFGTKIMYLHLAAFLFNTGVNVPLFLFFGTYNTKRVDLNARSSFNYQGTTYKSFLIILPVLFLPMVVMFLYAALGHIHWGMIFLALLGLAGIITREQILKLCVNQFNRRKYAMAEGFREQE